MNIVDGKCMDRLNDFQIEAMRSLVTAMNKNLYLSEIDYSTGNVFIGIGENAKYLSVNVSGESTGIMFFEVAQMLSKHL